MSEQGYTLVETLAALLIIALAISGLTVALQVLARGQAGVVALTDHADALRRAEVTMDRLFDGRGPFRSSQSDAFIGADHLIQFDCAQAAPCTVELLQASNNQLSLRVKKGGSATSLRLGAAAPAHFRYEGTLASLKTWPPPSEPRQALRAISIVQDHADDHAVLLESHLWTQEAATCAFDVVLQDCR